MKTDRIDKILILAQVGLILLCVIFFFVTKNVGWLINALIPVTATVVAFYLRRKREKALARLISKENTQ